VIFQIAAIRFDFKAKRQRRGAENYIFAMFVRNAARVDGKSAPPGL